MTNRQILKQAEIKLEQSGIDDNRNDAWLLFSFVTGMEKAYYYLHSEDEMNTEIITKYNEYITRRCLHEPLQYIVGKASFMGLEFMVNSDVLIPRFDTEVLVETALQNINSEMTVLDMCTGSGCIGICMDVIGNAKRVVEADLSEAALSIAEMNIKKLHAINTHTLCSDMFSNVNEKFDMILSNPPYIKTRDIDELMSEVKCCEPYMALCGHEDGLYFYHILAKESGKYLNPGGKIIMEIGYDEAEQVSELLINNNYTDIKVIKDLAGLDRVICGWRK